MAALYVSEKTCNVVLWGLQGRLDKSQAFESYASGSHGQPGRGGPSPGLDSEWSCRKLVCDCVGSKGGYSNPDCGEASGVTEPLFPGKFDTMQQREIR